MQRELDPKLFGNPEIAEDEQKLSPPSLSAKPFDSSSIGFQSLEIKELKQQLQMSQKRVQLLEEKLSQVISKMSQGLGSQSTSIEKLQKNVERNNKFIESLHKDLNESKANLSSKINERKVQESKIEDLLDRQNMVIRNFENRLTAMQKIINEKEIQLMNYASVLQEAQRRLGLK